jgi:uncharacterized oxidoreductase
MQTTGNTILITGGTSGIGFSFAEEFHRLGNQVIICGRRKERLQVIAEKYPGIITKQCDVANSAERKNLASWVVENYPALNVLINNAGIQLKTDLTQTIEVDKIRSEVETNLVAPVHLASLFTQHLIKKKKLLSLIFLRDLRLRQRQITLYIVQQKLPFILSRFHYVTS